MTWKDLKIFTLQKMFAITGDTLLVDDSTSPYIKSMPQAANEALQLLSTAGRFIRGSVTIEQGEDVGASTADVARVVSGGVQKYDFDALTEDFYEFAPGEVYYEAGDVYGRTSDFMIQGEKILALPGSASGVWTVYYNAYPHEITAQTDDEFVLPLHPEVAVLLPLYMASQLYKDDEPDQAVQFRNEFEVAREELINGGYGRGGGRDEFENTTGWW